MDGRSLDGRELRVQMARYGRPTSPQRRGGGGRYNDRRRRYIEKSHYLFKNTLTCSLSIYSTVHVQEIVAVAAAVVVVEEEEEAVAEEDVRILGIVLVVVGHIHVQNRAAEATANHQEIVLAVQFEKQIAVKVEIKTTSNCFRILICIKKGTIVFSFNFRKTVYCR